MIISLIDAMLNTYTVRLTDINFPEDTTKAYLNGRVLTRNGTELPARAMDLTWNIHRAGGLLPEAIRTRMEEEFGVEFELFRGELSRLAPSIRHNAKLEKVKAMTFTDDKEGSAARKACFEDVAHGPIVPTLSALLDDTVERAEADPDAKVDASAGGDFDDYATELPAKIDEPAF